MTTPPEDAAAPPPEIDWDAQGIETELGWALPAVHQGFSRSATGAVADVPAGPRGYQVLVAITTEEPSSQLALAHRLGIDKTQMTYVVDALEAAGLVERRPHPDDRRVRQVLPTAAGRTLLTSARAALRAVEADLMRHLSGSEQTQLRRLLARVALTAGDVVACAPGDPATPGTTPETPSPSRRKK
ncbi:MarR family winged helix-turn-helix transcriptional regulator [Kineococcus aurantiacus]|uniref:DNA-binding MarR family transcriptional regulator n=1 Tax=Kineococcus aurantiacus TaxID=37633 RepID=A0A7Y9DK61_9ACTN|nr:DNA-binding MarR family transcriptional regulator [Kineococcus aurantiacus]